MTGEERARAAAAAMMAADAASKWFGAELEEVREGYARMGLTVRAEHLNGHGICHGGVSFALADSAFAFACNSRNQRTVAAHDIISFVAPAQAGDRLTAEAREVVREGRSGIYDVRVTNQHGKVIAELRGFSRTIAGHLFDEEDAAAGQAGAQREESSA
ncbi:MAG: hydroxyphenylacetyl-CoA thioesterase PaaI [Alphaproteobacteria bacterium]|nr:MAG: hydroxyphenylacetyl-CoA thioesterase PaaI [Alphaproteobacteria bacterium]